MTDADGRGRQPGNLGAARLATFGARIIGAATGSLSSRFRPHRHAPDGGAHVAEFGRRAAAIRGAQRAQTVDDVRALRRRYLSPIFGRVRVWEMIEKLGMCVDPSDEFLRLTSQYLHVQQVLEAMEHDGVQEKNLFLVALLHDIGKVMLQAHAAPEHVVGMLTPVEEPAEGVGLANVVLQFGHDEFAYSRLKDEVPEQVAWTIRYHSAMVDDLRPYCDAGDLVHLDGCLRRFQPYDLGHKSHSHLPRIDMERYRQLIEELFPRPILF